jgi:adsorption protein B
MHGAESLLTIAEVVTAELALFAAAGFLAGAIGDLVIDGLWIGLKLRHLIGHGRREAALEALPPPARSGRHAIFVPAWQEAGVIGAMLETAVWRFAGQDCRIFVGCYANDPETIEEVHAVAARAANIRIVINTDPGPTTKADCLNTLWQMLIVEERRTATRFKSVILHDAEDLVHPAEIALFDTLIERHDLVQIPVIPLPDRHSLWIAGHYCDEFAEAHGKDLIVRDAIGAGVPSAGVGCAISRETLGRIADERGGVPFRPDSLTEDYELGLSIAERGGSGHFVRIRERETGELIAVRSHFPAKLGAAVRQKTRWVQGIALYGWERLGWHHGIADFGMRLRDRSSILAAMVLAAAYLGMVLAFLLLVLSLTTPYSLPPVPPGLALLLKINAVLLFWRLTMRAFFTAKSYGWAQGLLAVPRAVVANIIAMIAARRAVTSYAFAPQGSTPAWDKTSHVFPDQVFPDHALAPTTAPARSSPASSPCGSASASPSGSRQCRHRIRRFSPLRACRPLPSSPLPPSIPARLWPPRTPICRSTCQIPVRSMCCAIHSVHASCRPGPNCPRRSLFRPTSAVSRSGWQTICRRSPSRC